MDDPTTTLLLYFIMPLWLLAGFADWLCHRASDIAHTSGAKESAIHLLMFAEIAVPLLACLLFEVNAGIFLLMIAAFIAHEATTLWDLRYAASRRVITPVEQHVHSFLELLPLFAGLLVAILNWEQFLALFGLGADTARFGLEWKEPPLSLAYVTLVVGAACILDLLPYAEEWRRGRRARREMRPAL